MALVSGDDAREVVRAAGGSGEAGGIVQGEAVSPVGPSDGFDVGVCDPDELGTNDGRDVFELSFSEGNGNKLKSDAAYRGPVKNCQVRWHAIAGRSAEKGEPDEVYDVSFAPVGTLVSGQTLWFPASAT